jgi:intraflagellar transport protein 56
MTFVERRDWTGALALLTFQKNMEATHANDDLMTENRFWCAYCYTHMGNFHAAMQELDLHLVHDANPEPSVWLWIGVCKLGLGMYKEAEEAAFQGPPGHLQNRILFHVAHHVGDETQLMNYHQRLTSNVEDQLSLAGMHFKRGHYQEATDLYKRVLLEQREHLALNVYVALCYYKLDYYDVSLEVRARIVLL